MQSWSTSDLASLIWQGEEMGRIFSSHIALHKSDPFISKKRFCKIFKKRAIEQTKPANCPASQLCR